MAPIKVWVPELTMRVETIHYNTLFRFWPVEDFSGAADGPTRCGEVAWGGCLYTWNFSVTWPSVFTGAKKRR